ncbi:hypothetical protein HDE_14398 [Halotydeus destructor]|nr:hypothetical protein HDE_14398 [Halotydeus destructor]
MKAENVLVYVDHLQFLFGYKLFIKGWKQRLIQYSIRVISCFIAIYWLIDEFTHHMPTDRVMLSVRNVSLYVYPTLAAIPIMVKSNRLVFVMTQLVDLLSERQKIQFKRRSIVCVVLYVTIGITLLTIKIYGLCRNDFAELTNFTTRDWLWKVDDIKWYHTLYAFMFVTIEDCFHEKQSVTVLVSLYCSSLIIWSTANSRFMEFAINKPLVNAEDCLSMINNKQLLNDLKRQLDDLLSSIPLMILTALFLRSTGLIMRLQVHVSLTDVYRISAYLSNALLTVAMIMIVVYIQRFEESLNNKLLLDWHIRLVGVKDDRIVMKFNQTFSSGVKMTAILFPLDESLFLGFVGSLLTFTVMFLHI